MIALIVAMTKDRVIGNDNKLIWNIPEEMALFKKNTTGATVIMGRKTFDSIGRPLPQRHNIVISGSMPETTGIVVCRDVQEAFDKAKGHGKDVFVIGGSTVYRQTMPFVDKMYISWIKKYFEGDAYFPDIDFSEWEEEYKEEHEKFDFVIYCRKGKIYK